MKKKILLFGSIATVFAVGIGTVVASGIGQLDKLVATPNYTEHTIKLTKDDVVLDFEDSGSAYFGFYKENATLSGDEFKTNTNQDCWICWDGDASVGETSIVTTHCSYQYDSVYFGFEFHFTHVAQYTSVELIGNFVYASYSIDHIEYDDTYFANDTFYLEMSEGFHDVTINEIHINYLCA